jgi:hypothetical protein
VPLRDKTLPSVVIGLDRTLRAVAAFRRMHSRTTRRR